MPALLQAPGHAGWPHLQRLLLALLRFMEPYLRNADLIEAVRVLYKVFVYGAVSINPRPSLSLTLHGALPGQRRPH